MKVISAAIALAIATIVASPLRAQDTSAQPLTRADCEKAGQDWNDSANVCDSNSEVSNSASEPEQPAGVGTLQPLTRAACDQAALKWNDNANVCGSSAAGSPGSINEVVAEETPGQPLTRSACEAATMHWNESSNVCGTGSMPFTTREAATTETPTQPLTRADCDKAGMRWDESANVCGKTERKASTVRAVPVVVSKPKTTKAAKTAKSKDANVTKKSTKRQGAKKQRYTKPTTVNRRRVQAAPAAPERPPFRLFRNRPAATQ